MKKLSLLLLLAALMFAACGERSVSPDYTDERGTNEKPEVGTKPSGYEIYVYGKVSDSSGKVIPSARLYLILEDEDEPELTYHDVILDSTKSDSKGNFSFGYLDYLRVYRILAKLPSKSGKDSLLGYMDDVHFSWDGDSMYFDIVMDVPATLHLFSNYLNSWDNNPVDSVCFHGTLVCAHFSKEDQERGYTIVTGLPAGEFGDYYAWHGDGGSSVGCTIDPWAGDTLYVADDAAGYPVDSFKIALPKAASRILDSAKLETSIERLFVPMMRSTVNDPHSLIDETGEYVKRQWAKEETVEDRVWLTFPMLKKDSMVAYWLYRGWITDADHSENGNIRHLYAEVEPGQAFEDTLYGKHHDVYCWRIFYKTTEDDLDDNCHATDWQENTFAVSFWIDTDDEAKNGSVLSIGSDSLGIEMKPCESDAQSLCFEFASGKEKDVYAKSKVFDGMRHHVSLAMYNTLLAIVVDGVTIHESSLTISEILEGEVGGIRVGKFPLQDFVIYGIDSSIHNKDDGKDGVRLRAWLTAFYELQK